MIIYYRSHGITLKIDPKDDLVAIVLTDEDKYNITHMAPDNNIYCEYSDENTPKEVKEWLGLVKHLEEERTK